MLSPSTAGTAPGVRIRFRDLGELQRDPLTLLGHVQKEHGDVVRISLPFRTAYLVTDPEILEQLLLRDHHVFTKSALVRDLRYLLGDGLLTSEGEHWKRVRKLASPPLTKRAISAYADDMVDDAARFIDELTLDVPRDVHQDFMQLTLQIVTRTLFGASLPPGAEQVSVALHSAMDYFLHYSRSMKRLIPKWLPIPAHLRMRRAVKTIDGTLMQIIAARRAALTEDATDLLSLLLRARDDEGAGLTDVQLRDEAVTAFVAGHETTALALAYTLMLLATHPEVQTRVHAELDAVLGSRRPTAADMGRLSYLDAVLSESLRLYPPAWGMAREAREPYTLGGHLVRKGDEVWTLVWLVHRDPRWFEEPEAFKPERWTPELRDKLPRYAYLPFGGGPRICIGSHFALMESLLVLATILQRRSFTTAPDHALALTCSMTLRPKHGVRLIPHARDKEAEC
ncbi:MAG: cytochrome P450 [Myxococcota bacterium]